MYLTNELYSVVMAGGKGTRFWPLSRKDNPKQLLALTGKLTMLQATVDRLAQLSSPEKIFIVTGSDFYDEVGRQLPQLPNKNIISEPIGRNTAPCIALAAMLIEAKDPNAMMAVFPADHHIGKPDKLINTIVKLVHTIDKNPDKLGVIGIEPSLPETGYGYIKLGELMDDNTYIVEEFTEKPDYKVAKKYFESNQFFWNSGMFFWKAKTILEKFETYMPELFNCMKPLRANGENKDIYKTITNIYPGLPSESIDYGVIEPSSVNKEVIVAPCNPQWNDVGSLRSMYDLLDSDCNGNRSVGKHISINSSGVLAYSSKRVIATVGIENVVVVETEDAILVLNKDKAQDVRSISDQLKKEGLDQLL